MNKCVVKIDNHIREKKYGYNCAAIHSHHILKPSTDGSKTLMWKAKL